MNKSITEKYQKLDPIEHVLKRPGMYIGSIDIDNIDVWIIKQDDDSMIKKNIKYVAGCYKLFDEILVNAIDHSSRLKTQKLSGNNVNLLKNIRINISKEDGVIEVFNDGDGIDIAEHPEHKIYIPEMIFGNLLSSSNYDDSEERTIGGMNGLGAKLSNIFSTWFEIETVDSNRKLHYKQKFYDNMSKRDVPTITKYTKKPFTIIRFRPDYQKFFKLDTLPEDMYEMIKKRVYDSCAVTDIDINIFFNEKKLEFKNFEKYVDLYLGNKDDHNRVYEKINDRWEIVASYNEFNGFEQVSFVNGIWTIRGGKHVDYIVNQIVKKLTDLIQKKKKDVTVKPSSIKDNLFVFIKSTIINPTFDSQSKETLTTPISKFGSKGDISDKFIEKLYKSGIVEKILQISEIHDGKKMAKTDGKKKTNIRGLPKLEDANLAGGPKSSECTLILTEGDSAMTSAISGLTVVGRDRYGVFPLRGKMLNVRDQTSTKIADNDEINNIKKIIGLENGRTYDSVADLRYGKIMVMTDADTDGIHISGLLFNIFDSMWPSLLKCNQFMTSLLTPIVRCQKQNDVQQFYNLSDFENWLQVNDHGKGYRIKFLKGLGTSTSEESQQYFKDMRTVTYHYTDKSEDRLKLGFDKKKADERKEWLQTYDRQDILDHTNPIVTYEDFIDKGLKHFSNYDVERSIPNNCDGLKTSLRKIMYGCFKKNLTSSDIKVASLSGYVSEIASYHHGETSLQSAIIGMAQDFVGSNNIPLLKANGQFGSRRMGGQDAASSRYVYTVLSPITQTLYKKDDNHILEYLKDDGQEIEPTFYMPVLPMILINGSCAIATGFSCSIPCYNPIDIINVIHKLMASEPIDTVELVPWYRNFKGKIEKNSNGKYVSRGLYNKVSATRIDITELPVGYWTMDFKEHLESVMDKHPEIKNYESHYTETDIKFIIHFTTSAICEEYLQVETNGYTKLENTLKLISPKGLGSTNMYLFNSKCQIQKYDTPLDIICDFYFVRLQFYQKRKDHLLKKLQDDIEVLNNKIRFIKAVVSQEIIVHTMKKCDLESRILDDGYMKVDGKFDYLVRIPIYNLTLDQVAALETEKQQADDEIKRVTDLDIKEWWKADINDFVKLYNEYQGAIVKDRKSSKISLVKKVVNII